MQRAVTIQTLVENDLVKHPSGVWQLKGHDAFGYSDGIESERYLDGVFHSAEDLTTRSDELVRHIKDWPSEYHLTPKRAQLLSGFAFDRDARVLEVGCGCGAISRHLGETFDSVVSVEGSINRAKLARLRTRDLPSVDIICAPFQEIKFSQKFDIIFVIGVFEYSGQFIDAENPYQAALKYFSELLTPNGKVVIAIENQFGLKYFNGCREDHLGKTYEGLEGYHRGGPKVRTFGRAELERQLNDHFSNTKFYYPYPDYKMPDCVVSEEFLSSEDAGELISQMVSRPNPSVDRPLWDEPATIMELSRNGLLSELANSFLVIASKGDIEPHIFDQRAVLYAPGRKADLTTKTRIIADKDGRWHTDKRAVNGQQTTQVGRLTLVGSDTPWRGGKSLQCEVTLRALRRDAKLDDIFAPCQKWLAAVNAEAFERNERVYIPGDSLDKIWQNYFADAEDGAFIDQEWKWDTDIAVNVLVIRAIYYGLTKIEKHHNTADALKMRSGKALITAIAKTLDVTLSDQDFSDFIALESEIAATVFASNPEKLERFFKWYLLDRTSQKFYQRTKRGLSARFNRVRQRLAKFKG